jgi:DNA (cytosine-5)-methyltransferase 1
MSKNFAYYNEWDKNAAAWLRELIKRGLIADGIVDERSIAEVSPDDIRGFNQCHWFAGVGGWSYSLRIAGIPDEYPVWTASLPCQPFSAAGKQLGKADERHLLPHFLELVRQCQPSIIFGEQVPGAIRHGWLDDLYTEMEASSYAVGSIIAGAHSVGSYHQRQRLYWVANAKGERERRASRERNCQEGEAEISGGHKNRESIQSEPRGAINDGMADSCGKGLEGRERAECTDKQSAGQDGMVGGMGDAEHQGLHNDSVRRAVGESENTRRLCQPERSDSDIEWLYCRDNKYRPVKPGIKPLVDGIPRRVVRSGDSGEPINANETAEARVMRLKGYGNAIVPQVAAEFIRAFMEIA